MTSLVQRSTASGLIAASFVGKGLLPTAMFLALMVGANLPTPPLGSGSGSGRIGHLHPVALATPSLALGCAAREALHQADVVATRLRGILPVLRDNDLVPLKKPLGPQRALDSAVIVVGVMAMRLG